MVMAYNIFHHSIFVNNLRMNAFLTIIMMTIKDLYFLELINLSLENNTYKNRNILSFPAVFNSIIKFI